MKIFSNTHKIKRNLFLNKFILSILHKKSYKGYTSPDGIEIEYEWNDNYFFPKLACKTLIRIIRNQEKLNHLSIGIYDEEEERKSLQELVEIVKGM